MFLNEEFKIRSEESTDIEGIDKVIRKAFSKNSNSNLEVEECRLVNELRKGSCYVSELSLVAEASDKIIGHILFTKAHVGKRVVLCLAPLSVDPNFQNQGVGTALVKEGHKRAKELGYEYSVVLGDPNFYRRFGYELASNYGIKAPAQIPSKYLQAIKLSENAPALVGIMEYPKEFGI